jgi:hypothetical protein
MEYQLLSAEEIVAYFVDDDPTVISYAWNAKHYEVRQSEYAIIFASCEDVDLTDLDRLIGGDCLAIMIVCGAVS